MNMLIMDFVLFSSTDRFLQIRSLPVR